MAVGYTQGDLLLGRYEITGLLGEGGVGVVYEAQDTRLQRPVAVKVLRRTALRNRTAAQRMLREAQTLAAVSHPNLVVLLDYELLPEGVPALVMERVRGISAQGWLKHRPFTVHEAVTVVHQSLGALAACHDVGITHRDLKPSNILIEQRHDGRPFAKVIDFGIVHLAADDGATALTLQGEVFGSPRYMAPEQWTQKPVDARTDVYAMGLIAHVLLAGRHFIGVTNPVQVFEAHLSAPRPRLEASASGERVPPLVANAILKAIHPDPDRRFPDCDAFKAALEPLLTPSGSYQMPDASYFEDASRAHLALAETEAPEPSARSIAEDDATMVDMDGSFAARLAVMTGQHMPPAPKEAGDERVGVPGVDAHAISRDDFERALASTPPPEPSPPPLRRGSSVLEVKFPEATQANASLEAFDGAETMANPALPAFTPTPDVTPGHSLAAPSLWQRVLGKLLFWRKP